MAFWGVEVKPGRPFTHQYDASKGRLHISMGTLGFGAAEAKSTLQCNVGNKSPVYLCSLYPRHAESLPLNLEFQELVDNVTFSVVGPRSIHLCGYYLPPTGNTNILHDDSESHGVDIANTESDRSQNNDQDDMYDDSFIDDNDDPEVFPPSPISNEEGATFDNRSKTKKGSLRRLRKKYQSVDSNDSMHVQSKDIDNEDSLPISSAYKNKATRRDLDKEMDESVDKGAGDVGNKNGEDGGKIIPETESETDSDDGKWDSRCLFPTQTIQMNRETEVCREHDEKPKKKMKDCSKEKDRSKEVMYAIAYRNMPPDEHNKQDTVNEDVKMPVTVALPSGEMDRDKRTKRKKKEKKNKASHLEGGDGFHEDTIQDYKANRDQDESDNLIHKCPEGKEQHKPTDEKTVDDGTLDFPDGNQSEDRKVKRRKKKSRSQREVANSDMPVSVEQSNEMLEEDGNKRADAKPSQVRTLSNGLVIQELETGTKDGKIAALGKKISINYTGKLKESGVVFESNADQSPFKFRLGKGEVIEGWDVGLEGMRVGEKRRLVIPPSMTSESDGHSTIIPPNSWLVYDVELVKVH